MAIHIATGKINQRIVQSNREIRIKIYLVIIIVGLLVSKGFYRVKPCSFPRRIKTEENSYCRGKAESEKNDAIKIIKLVEEVTFSKK